MFAIVLMTVAVFTIALFAGLLANRFIRPRARGDDRDEGYSLNDLMSPFETLAVLLLAFVLVVAAESYGAAEESAKLEADAVENLYEVATFAPEQQQRALQASVICYTRAIKSLEWPIMTRGGISEVADSWTNGFIRTFESMSRKPYFELLVKADQQRSKARNNRIAQAQPAVPTYMFWFMALVLGLSVVGFAFALPRRNNIFQIVTLSVLTVLFALSLALIRDVDRPFTGFVNIGFGALTTTQEHITGLYSAKYNVDKIPCDKNGEPTSGAASDNTKKLSPAPPPGSG